MEGKYNGTIFEKNKENREMTLVGNSQKKRSVSLEQREMSLKQREKRCSKREHDIDLELRKRLDAELKRLAIYIRLMQIKQEWETRYANIYKYTKSHARYLTALEKEHSKAAEQERNDIYADKITQKKQNDHSRTDPKTFDGR